MDDNQNNHGRALAGRSTQPKTPSLYSNLTNLEPATARDAVRVLASVLTIVVPTGMTKEERTTWFTAASTALKGIPLDLLERGAAVAMVEADHPSKIVKIIHAAIKADWDWRKNHATPVEIHTTPVEVKAIEDNTAVSIETARRWTIDLLGMGLRQGWLAQADYDTIIAERDANGERHD